MKWLALAGFLAASTAVGAASAPAADAVAWTATCGTVSSSGLYTAPDVAGSCLVIASASGAADTAVVTVTGCTGSSTVICPGDNWQAKSTAAATSTVFTVAAGTHWLQSVAPKAGQQFIGETGAIMDGGKVLTGWSQSGATWYVTGQTQQAALSAKPCWTAYPACNYREDLWVDDSLYQRVLSVGAVSAGKWYFDYTADRIYLPLDPTSHTVVTSVTGQAFSGSATGVVIRGLTVRHYANDAQTGCIAGSGWTVDSSDISGCHGIGIRLTGTNPKIRWNRIHHNGQMGVTTAGGSGGLVYGNEIDHNATAGYKGTWEAGASKFVLTTNLVVRQNSVHHNYWNGLWPDINNTNTTVDSNHVYQNYGTGIFCEISWGCTVAYNTVDSNGVNTMGVGGTVEGTGILCAATADCAIYGNVLHRNKNNDILLYQTDRSADQPDGRGDHLVTNADVHDNTTTAVAGSSNGFKGSYQQTAFNTSRNNCYTNNTWHLPASGTFFSFNGSSVSDGTWQAAGCNSGETITR